MTRPRLTPLSPFAALLRRLQALVAPIALAGCSLALGAQPVAAELPPMKRMAHRNPADERLVATKGRAVSQGKSTAPYLLNSTPRRSTTSARNGADRCYAPVLEALLVWAEQLVTRLDPLDIFETPFSRLRRSELLREPSNQKELTARVRLVQMPNGGYGLATRVNF